MKLLAIATAKRLPEVPDVPTFRELGYDVIYAVNRGIVAPKRTPEAVLAKLEEACAKAAKDPTFAESMKKQGTLVQYLNRKEYADFLQKNDKMNADLSQALGYKRK
jgi:tripartite-type tricarboxylate transporter receptor subunit TctC